MKDSYTRARRTIGKTFPNGISTECGNKLGSRQLQLQRGQSEPKCRLGGQQMAAGDLTATSAKHGISCCYKKTFIDNGH